MLANLSFTPLGQTSTILYSSIYTKNLQEKEMIEFTQFPKGYKSNKIFISRLSNKHLFFKFNTEITHCTILK